jgi:hypothetical protein
LINAGALAAGALSLSISGLTAGTNYSLYIRSNCGAQNSEWAPFLLTTACSATYVPYNENFDGVAAPTVPTCTKVEEFFDQYKWSTATGIERSSPNSLYHPFNFSSPFDDWFFTAALQLTAGRTYQLSFYFREQAAGYIDALEIKMGRYAQGDSMTSAPIYVNTNINNTTYQLATVTFTVPATGVYYLGLHSIFDYQSRGLSVDDFGINEMTPDLFISNQSLSAATAATSEVITANFTLNNQGLNNAGASKTYFYLSADNVLTPGANGDTLIGLYNHASSLLAGTNTGSIASVLNIPCNLAPGNYTLFFVADGETAVTEINETNNSASSTLTITAGAQWNGSINNNWETAGNWSCSQVPGPTTDVTINTGTVVVNAGTTIRSLTVKPGVSFTLAPGVVLTVLH